jgi:hypothetical protein
MTHPLTSRSFDLVATFSARELRLSCPIDESDRARLLDQLDCMSFKHRFHGLELRSGLECFLNTAHLVRVNLLEELPGIEVLTVPKPPPQRREAIVAERAKSDVRVYLRVWVRGVPAPILHSDIELDAWGCISCALDEGARFIAFADEDAEDLIYGTDHIDAVEMIDPYYFDDDQLAEFLERYDPQPEFDLPQPPADSDVPF